MYHLPLSHALFLTVLISSANGNGITLNPGGII